MARLPKGSDPAELAQHDPDALRQSVTMPCRSCSSDSSGSSRARTLATAEGRARAAEHAMVVLAEHPSELVRDQYVMQVADRLRLDVARLRPRVAELARNPRVREPRTNRPADGSSSTSRVGIADASPGTRGAATARPFSERREGPSDRAVLCERRATRDLRGARE